MIQNVVHDGICLRFGDLPLKSSTDDTVS